MRKLIFYLLLLYPIFFVSVVAYNRLTPAPPPPPPSKWDLFWREHGDIVAAGLLIMLSLLELAVGIFAFGGVLVLLKKGWTIWAHSVGRSGGLAPVIRDKHGNWLDVNPEGAVLAAAIAAHAPKVTASMARNMMGAALGAGRWSVQDAPVTDAPLDVSYEVVKEFRPDMVDARGHGAQHHIFVGPTGSGKSVAAYSVLDEMRRQQPDATFLIFEPARVEWKHQAVTGDFDELFDLVKALHDEMRQRQETLANHATAVHAFELGLPPIVFFIEEAGAALDYYKLSPDGAKRAKAFTLYLRNLLREARKTGISVIMADQAAMAETIPTQVLDNVPHVWLMVKGASPKLLRRWGLTEKFRKLKEAGVLADRPGLSYDYHADALIQFPKRERPQLMLKAPKLSTVLAGINAGFQSGSSGTWSGSNAVRIPVCAGSEPVKPLGREENGSFSGISHVPVRTDAVKSTSARTNQFDAERFIRQMALRTEREGQAAVISYQAARVVYQQYQQAGSIKGLQRRLWPNVTPGGHRFYWIRDIIEQFEERERSRPTVTVVSRPKTAPSLQNGGD